MPKKEKSLIKVETAPEISERDTPKNIYRIVTKMVCKHTIFVLAKTKKPFCRYLFMSIQGFSCTRSDIDVNGSYLARLGSQFVKSCSNVVATKKAATTLSRNCLILRW